MTVAVPLDFRSYELAEPGTGIRAWPLLTALPDAAAALRQIPACWRSRPTACAPPRRAGMHAVPACLIRRTCSPRRAWLGRRPRDHVVVRRVRLASVLDQAFAGVEEETLSAPGWVRASTVSDVAAGPGPCHPGSASRAWSKSQRAARTAAAASSGTSPSRAPVSACTVPATQVVVLDPVTLRGAGTQELTRPRNSA